MKISILKAYFVNDKFYQHEITARIDSLKIKLPLPVPTCLPLFLLFLVNLVHTFEFTSSILEEKIDGRKIT